MPSSELQRINAFLSAFARRQAAHTVDLPGGFAVYDDAFAHSRANNQVVVDTAVDPEALPAIAEEALGHLPHRMISVLDDAAGTACAEPLIRAGYTHSTYLVMLHAGPVPAGGPAEEMDLDAIRTPLTRRWRGLLPDVDDEVVRHLVDRREARRRGADIVHFIGARAEEGEVASWADLYLDPATGTAQIEDLITSEAHLRRGYADAVLTTALRLAADADCGTRFLTADAADWPRHWYERRGLSVIGHSHCFERG
ncbi:GNAT family N-acetyltransferase [Streptomyces sp. NBC_01221]|uniref:GNAT family N-acetyltransferase n=1 Tax=unclassified Streptomyces TaxID=2593676 RepID=UPI0022518633|nr:MULTISPECIES: GNAT family N-acetyltransferase [unclassified Streptomyces]WSP57944.1 GNAT family N-acetyltransferase [Streptomyces sp. NBC_01241]WSU21318.1 GNAT family N-acetyltransferase [Streptomyces sp. NBC_01108]MCX4789866.1 GNAT family N-acetyltransferase [Streptomyces sp. NBC_01221]MCX4794432.1 GNAT family N-acetyltransferase [Streptomyces sp. NBC_01242]WSJ35781.1 GNAT family N-acetyltransferase [Streptomyces sp. NBC_01321]